MVAAVSHNLAASPSPPRARVAVGQPLDDLDPRDERSAVLVKGPPESCCGVPVRPDTRRQLGGLDQPRHRLVRLTGIEPMAGHCERFCVPRGEKGRDLAVGRASFVRWHFLVHHVSDEGMPERYGAVRAGHQDPAFQTGLDPSAGVRDDPFDECYVNLVAHDRRDRERLSVPGRHPIGSDEDGVSERLRDGQVCLNQGRQTVDDRDRAFCQECARELLDEKRESLTAIHEPAGKDGVGSRSEDARRKLAGRVDPQRTERDLRQVTVAPEVDPQPTDGVRARELIVSIDADDEERFSPGPSGQHREGIDRRVVGVLKVIEDDRDGLDPRKRDHECADRVAQSGTVGVDRRRAMFRPAARSGSRHSNARCRGTRDAKGRRSAIRPGPQRRPDR